jgi:SAM-dependent methyltransferase
LLGVTGANCMIGSELAAYPEYLAAQASGELGLNVRVSGWRMAGARAFVALFGVPEIGLRIRTQHILHWLPRDVGRLIDLGCGAGSLLGAVARSRRFAELVGLEINERSAQVAARAHPYARIAVTRVQDAPAEFSGFDFAVSADVLEHLPEADVAQFLQAAHAMLKDDGLLVISVPGLDQWRYFAAFRNWTHDDHQREGFSVDGLARAVRESGFRVLRCYPTGGRVFAFCWELNMLLAGNPLQALVFPVTLLATSLAERLPRRRGNTLVCVARRADAARASGRAANAQRSLDAAAR